MHAAGRHRVGDDRREERACARQMMMMMTQVRHRRLFHTRLHANQTGAEKPLAYAVRIHAIISASSGRHLVRGNPAHRPGTGDTGDAATIPDTTHALARWRHCRRRHTPRSHWTTQPALAPQRTDLNPPRAKTTGGTSRAPAPDFTLSPSMTAKRRQNHHRQTTLR